MSDSTLTRSQFKEFTKSTGTLRIKATVRYDDQCGNGHNSFSIMGETYEFYKGRWREAAYGCTDGEVLAKHFPELSHLIKWRLCSSDGPPYYVANTTYYAKDTDCWGLRKGEKNQIRKDGKTPCWRGVVYDSEGKEIDLGTTYSVASQEKPADNGDITFVPWCRVGEGKTPDIEAARSNAIWPDATLEELQDEEKLLARLPKLLEEFRKDVEALGFTW